MSESVESESGIMYRLSPMHSKLNPEGHKVYVARMKPTVSYRDDDLIRDVAEATNQSEAAVRYFEEMRRAMIERALRDGKAVYVGGVANIVTVQGPFDTIDGEFDPSRNKLAVTGFTYGSRQRCLEGIVPENMEKGALPRLGSVREEGQAENELCVAGRTISITGSDLKLDASAEDEGVRLVDAKTGEVVSVAAVESSGLTTAYCRFAELPPPGRYMLVVATRAGLSREHKVAEASREVAVMEV